MIKRSILIFVILSIIASGLNYIVYPLFSRILEPEEYVSITVSLSLFTQVSAFLSSILAITIGLSKSEVHERANEKIELLQAFLFKLFLVLAVIFLLISPIVMSKVNTPTLFAIPICIMMFLSIPILIISGYLNGKNQMVKLGLVIVVSAGTQFTIGLLAALLSQDGLITMISMAVSQVITLVLVYTLFSKDNLPGIIRPLKMPINIIRQKRIGSLVVYAALTSIAVMAISLVQIVDLFILQSLENVDVKFYADIYVISRIVFFIGMIFIWPFLGEISVDHHHFNRKPFLKVVGYFTVVTIAAVATLYFFGHHLAYVLFGTDYTLQAIREVGILSVLYKFLMLIITAVILYFIVLRSYVAVWLSLAVSGVIFIFTELTNKGMDMATVLLQLSIIATIAAILGIILLLRVPIHKKSTH